MLKEESDRMTDLHNENIHLREILSARMPVCRTGPPSAQLVAGSPTSSSEASQLATELATELKDAKVAKAELERELLALRSSKTIVSREDHTSEVSLLRSSLATLASALEVEKSKNVQAQNAKKAEEEKVNGLKTKMDDSRRALVRVQNDQIRRASSSTEIGEGPQRFQSTGSLFDPSSIRRSSLISMLPVGLGLGVDPPGSNIPSSPSSAKASPLHRLAHRRGSTSISILPESGSDENDQLARLRALRLGVTTTKVQSRRGSLAPGADFSEGVSDFGFAPEKKRIPSLAFIQTNFNDVDSNNNDNLRPPSAPLRNQGRNDSVAIFADWNRRCSAGSNTYDKEVVVDTIEQEDLRAQLESLRAQLAESEEARRTSDMALKGLKDYIATTGTVVGDGSISLPALSSEVGTPNFAFPGAFPVTPEKRQSMSRWSISNRFGSLGGGGNGGRRDSSSLLSPASPSPFAYNASPNLANLTTYNRRTSTASNYSTSSSTTFLDRPTPSAASQAIFGQFSFSALVNRSSSLALADISPTITEPPHEMFPSDMSPVLGGGRADSENNFSSPSTSSTVTAGGDGGGPPSLTDSASSRSSSPIEPALEMLRDEVTSFDQDHCQLRSEDDTRNLLLPAHNMNLLKRKPALIPAKLDLSRLNMCTNAL